jgi:hypothetical protein
VAAAQAGGGEVVVPAALLAAGAGHRPGGRQADAVLGGEPAERGHTIGAVEVQDVEAVAGPQADVGLGVLRPPGQDAGPVGGRLVQAVGDECPEGVLAGLGAGTVAARAAQLPARCRRLAGRVADGCATGWCKGRTGMPPAA